MKTGTASAIFNCHSSRQGLETVFLGSLRRILIPLLCRLVRYGEVSYNSPPMSDPPTPSRIPQHDSSPLIRDTRPAATASTTTSTHMPGLAITTTTFEPPFYESIPRQIEPDRQPAGHATLMQPAQSSLQPDPGQESTHGQETSQIATQSSGFRGGRKAKAHVASACINCKRAHLSCDIGRPCARCIASGKQVCLVRCLAKSRH